ncbi:MAG TPA: nucleoside triphosphate pyrophosphohydrolase [Syntrophobacteraceae bacterium]|nr:nucleoside triphosphate pyrophosphohydrolase [Syntrophobacteraceae bacterium]HBZ55664.1 nucleoside triphosphate pyrophosphohydrolase [Syntrophobacteraceae bacterium]
MPMHPTAPSRTPREDLAERFLHVARIWEIIDQLRGDPGCPWDRKQTPQSVQTYLVEEAHEAAAAIVSGQSDEAMDELGDLLFMTLFVMHLYEEAEVFSLEEVCSRITSKMIRRHPHVFGDTVVESSREVRDNWEKIKAAEASSEGKESGLTSIPATLPALMRAYRVMSRLASRQPAWDDPSLQRGEASKRFLLLEAATMEASKAPPELFGELLLSVVNLARIAGFRAEDCLQQVLNALLAVSSKAEPPPTQPVAPA